MEERQGGKGCTTGGDTNLTEVSYGKPNSRAKTIMNNCMISVKYAITYTRHGDEAEGHSHGRGIVGTARVDHRPTGNLCLLVIQYFQAVFEVLKKLFPFILMANPFTA